MCQRTTNVPQLSCPSEGSDCRWRCVSWGNFGGERGGWQRVRLAGLGGSQRTSGSMMDRGLVGSTDDGGLWFGFGGTMDRDMIVSQRSPSVGERVCGATNWRRQNPAQRYRVVEPGPGTWRRSASGLVGWLVGGRADGRSLCPVTRGIDECSFLSTLMSTYLCRYVGRRGKTQVVCTYLGRYVCQQPAASASASASQPRPGRCKVQGGWKKKAALLLISICTVGTLYIRSISTPRCHHCTRPSTEFLYLQHMYPYLTVISLFTAILRSAEYILLSI